MSVKITATSTCDLPRELLERYQIDIAPLYVSFGCHTYRDGVDMAPEDIFRHVESGGELPTTAAVNIDDYLRLFGELSPKYDGVIHITIGAEFSACYQSACVAAEEFPNVYVVDSRNLTAGQGLLVLEAAEAAERGESAENIVTMLESRLDKADTTFVVDRLDYLVKGGRVPALVGMGANLLKLKPSIVLTDGKMGVGKKYRGTFEKALGDYVRDLLKKEDISLDRVFVAHSRCDPAIPTSIMSQLRAFGFREVFETVVGSTVSCHCGPNTLGVIFMHK